MEKQKVRFCPSCGSYYKDPPAISRKNKEIEICPECGMREALEEAGIESIFGETLRMFREARKSYESKTSIHR